MSTALYSLFSYQKQPNLALILARTRDRTGAIGSLHSAMEIHQSLAANDPANALVARDLAGAQRQLRT